MLGLKLPTDPRWVNIVETNISEILTDHAYCEQKAATNAINIVIQFPEYPDMVDALLELAREASPALITTTDIATAVGVSQGAVFKHFATKEAIWVAAMQWVRAHLLAQLQASAVGAATGVLALEAVFQAHVDFVIAHPGVPRVIFQELQQPLDSPVKQEVRALLQAYRLLLLQQFQRGMQAGELPAGLDPEAAATLFVGIVQGLVMQSMLSGRPAAMQAQAGAVFAIYLRGIRAAA